MNGINFRQRLSVGFSLMLILLFGAGFADAALQCYECHGSKIPIDYRPIDDSSRNVTTGGFVGNHRAHISITTDFSECPSCHPGSAAFSSSHRDGMIKVSANINASPLQALYRNSSSAFPQTSAPSPGTCSNVNCHFERTTQTWGGPQFTYPDGCNACHGSPPSGGGTGIAGSHAKHDGYYGGVTNCIKCHADHVTFSHATSVGRNLVVVPRDRTNVPSGSYAGALNNYLPSQSKTFGSCVNTYCHSDGTSLATSIVPVNVSAQWGTALDCNGCHGNPPAYANGTPKANSHAKHGYGCNTCHAATTADGTTITTRANHLNKSYNVDAGNGATFSYSYSPTGGTCVITYCHSNGTSLSTGTTAVNSATWGGTSYTCNGCHGYPPAYVSGSIKANSHQVPDHAQWRCNKCHAGTTATGFTITNPANHANGAFDVSPVSPGLFTSYIYSPTGGTCTNVGCHFDIGNRQWGTVLACNACHDSPPQTPAHLKHFGGTLADAAYGDLRIAQDFGANATAYIMNCGNCHPMDKSRHRNGVVEVELFNPLAAEGSLKKKNPSTASYTPGTDIFFDSRGFGYTKGTCKNIYCHSYTDWTTPGGVPKSTNPSYLPSNLVTSTYYRTATWEGPHLDCSGCHANPPRTSAPANDGGAGNSHSWIDEYGYEGLHNYNMGFNPVSCSYCHYDTVRGVNSWTRDAIGVATIGQVPIHNFSKHVNGRADVAFNQVSSFPFRRPYSLASATYDPATKTCSNISCHRAQTSVIWGTPYRWYYDPDECNRCHSY